MDLSCKYCNKTYASQSSRSNHIKKYHMKNVVEIIQPVVENVVKKMQKVIVIENNKANDKVNDKVNDILMCKYCNKSLCDRFYRWRHEKKCKEKELSDTLILKKENKQIKEEIKELKTIVTNLSKTNGTKSIINLNNNGTINIVNNINSLGYEDIQKKLSEREKINLVTSMRVKEHPIIELVRKIYTDDKFIEDRNTLITNLRAKDCLIYNSDTNKFDATTKADHIDNIIENRKNNIVSIYNELSTNNKLRPVEIKAIDTYLEEIENLGKKNPKVKELYEKHKAEIIYIIYNCKEFMNKVRDNLPDVVENGDDENTIEV